MRTDLPGQFTQVFFLLARRQLVALTGVSFPAPKGPDHEISPTLVSLAYRRNALRRRPRRVSLSGGGRRGACHPGTPQRRQRVHDLARGQFVYPYMGGIVALTATTNSDVGPTPY